LKNFPGGYTPVKRGGEEKEDGRRRGLGIQMRRRGVVWDRGEEGMMRVIEERDGKGGRKEEDDFAPPQTKFLDPPLP
jgi:hypothetical protein